MTTVEKIKLLSGNDETISDELIELYIEMVEQRIINYTNLTSVPTALILDVLIPMTVSMVNDAKTTSLLDQKVGSVSEGGRTVVFRQEDYVSIELTKLTDRMTFYEDQLNKFRRLI